MLSGTLTAKCHQSLAAAYQLLHAAGIAHDEHIVENCPCLPTARNTLVAMFLNDPQATDLFFVDADVGFEPTAVLRVLERPEGIVAGIYPLKRDAGGYPVKPKTIDDVPIGRAGLVEADFLPAGFMRIKRICFDSLMAAYPELRYADSVVEVLNLPPGITTMFDFFHMGIDAKTQRWTTEDYAFCQRWRDIGGQLWILPDINFEHVGPKAYSGNYEKYLRGLPGGADDPRRDISRAMLIPGWMSPAELQWLAEAAKQHQCIVELGSHLGRSTRALADNTAGTVYAIDDWKGPRQFKDGTPNTQWEEVAHKLLLAFQKNLAAHIASGKVVPIQTDHAEAITKFPGVMPDMVFIDGDHDYEPVVRDISLWKDIMAPGGLLCGHDTDWDGVARAVKDTLPGAENVPDTMIWCWRAPQMEMAECSTTR
jgi:predicted O-methyltransferase YrrM